MLETTMVAAAERLAYRHGALLRDPIEARQARFPEFDDLADATKVVGPVQGRGAHRPLRLRRSLGPRTRRLLHRR